MCDGAKVTEMLQRLWGQIYLPSYHLSHRCINPIKSRESWEFLAHQTHQTNVVTSTETTLPENKITESEAIWPENVLTDNNNSVRTIQRSSFQLWPSAPVCPVHLPVTWTTQHTFVIMIKWSSASYFVLRMRKLPISVNCQCHRYHQYPDSDF